MTGYASQRHVTAAVIGEHEQKGCVLVSAEEAGRGGRKASRTSNLHVALAVSCRQKLGKKPLKDLQGASP